MDVRCLSIHANYRCAHSGTCCRTGWHLPVAPDALVFLTNALESGALRTSRSTDDDRPFQAPNDAPRDVAAIVAADSSGACVFLDSDTRCAIHRQLDIGRLPVPCQQFPRVSVLGPDHTSVTLSHYCPTAARMLVDSPADLRIVRAPASLLTAGSLDGLDVRDAIPPLLRPGTLMGWPEYERWEHHLVHTLNRDELTPEQAVRALVDDAEAVRGWAADVASLGEHLEEICERRVAWMPETSEGAVDLERARSLHTLARGAVPEELPSHVPIVVPSKMPALHAAWARWVEPSWVEMSRPVRRYLAARSFASWYAHQGDGLRTTIVAVEMALGVLVVEACRVAARAERPIDADVLVEALQAADLLLVHLAAPVELATRLSAVETDARTSSPSLRFAVNPPRHTAH